jgi:hypothetical protein
MEWDLGRRLVPEYDDFSLFPCFLSPCNISSLNTLAHASSARSTKINITILFTFSATALYSTLSKAVRDGITSNDLVEQR